MGSRQRLESFLERAREAGEFDSEGHFTLNRHKAAGKLAAFLLPRGGYWLLKLVQAAVLARADSLEINEGQHALTVRMKASRKAEHRDFTQSLLNADLKETWTSQLAQALRAVGIGENRSWVSTLHGDGHTTHLACTDGNLSTETLPDWKPDSEVLEWQLTVELAAEEDRPETALLPERALTSSVPLTVNGVRVDTLQFAQDHGYQSFPIGVRWVVSPDGNRLQIPPAVRQPGVWNYVPAFTLNSRVNRMIAAHFNYVSVRGGTDVRPVRTESSLNLIRHGVVVARRSLDLFHGVSVDIFLYAQDEWMDLSGLKAEPPRSLLENAEEEVTSFSGSLRDLSRQMVERRWTPKPVHLWCWCGASLLSGVVTPLAIPVVGAGAISWVLGSYRKDAKIRHRMTDAIEGFRKSLPLVIRR